MTDDKTLFPPTAVYSLFSGGKDSFACAAVLADAGLLKGCILIDTGISADTWLHDATTICTQQSWTYEVIPTSVRYDWFVWRYGFPGPGMHNDVMNYLKGRAIREFRKDHKEDALASGVRLDESDRRTFNAKFESLFETVTVYAPILNWTTAEVWAYVRARGYERPQTYVTLGVSGDCLCGAFAQDHEREAITAFYPKLDRLISSIELKRGEKWGQRSRDTKIKVRGHKKLTAEDQALLCFDCKRSKETPA